MALSKVSTAPFSPLVIATTSKRNISAPETSSRAETELAAAGISPMAPQPHASWQRLSLCGVLCARKADAVL